MHFSQIFLGVLSLVGAATAIVVERQTLYCGTQPYLAKDYTCYPGNLLCPITGGVIYQQCGVACYDPANYGCDNGNLHPVGVCNGQTFDKNSYVCVNGFLCPKGFPNVCGTACYSLSQYRCEGGKLVQQ